MRQTCIALVALMVGCSSGSPLADGGADVPADTGSDVQNADSGSDTPVPIDAPGDVQASDAADAADAGPIDYDVTHEYPRLSIFAGFRSGADYVHTAAPLACSTSGDGGNVTFSLRACVEGSSVCLDVNGTIPAGSDGGGASVTFRGAGGATLTTTDVHVARGPVYGDSTSFLQSVHVTVRAPGANGIADVTGIPGRTLSPDYGDLWLMGCPFR